MGEAQTTRGARKLAAAIEAFDLAARIAGAQALDVGASTGGFTAMLLAHGAARVTAIEVGHDQLAPALRGDARVELHERTDFRRAPLALAPGPFAFFTVDVGFMAARNVLRSLAFRLAPGAEGVVLLKPQFELPTGQVRDGAVDDPALRARALARFRERAERLGFELLAQIDSEVAGGSGTIEMLLHLRFRERPAHMPKPGEKKPPVAPPARARQRKPAAADRLEWFAIAAPGFEAIVADELRAMQHVADVTPMHGGVAFHGPLAAGYEVNLRARVATRVLVRLGEVPAREFAQLRRRAGSLAFEAWLAPERPVRVQVSTRHSRLYHTKALAETLLLAAGNRLRAPLTLQQGAEQSAEHDAEQDTDEAEPQPDAREPFGREPFSRVMLRGEDNRFLVSIDTSGLLLHRRGGRAETGRAPLRETLAAGILSLAGYRGDEALINPMCGAGTIAIEAADIACARVAGRARAFAFEGFPNFDARAFAALRASAATAERTVPPAPIHAFDRDARAIERARRNAARAHTEPQVVFAQADFDTYAPPCAAGLVVLNPPYGRRLSAGDARALFSAIGDTLRTRWRGFRAAVLVPPGVSPKVLGLRGARIFPLRHGGLHVQLLIADL